MTDGHFCQGGENVFGKTNEHAELRGGRIEVLGGTEVLGGIEVLGGTEVIRCIFAIWSTEVLGCNENLAGQLLAPWAPLSKTKDLCLFRGATET